MRMFDNFNNIPEDYVPDNRHKKWPFHIDKNLTYSFSNTTPLFTFTDDIVGVQWQYGAQIDLVFKVEGEIIDNDKEVDINKYLSGKWIKFEIFDHLYRSEFSRDIKCECRDNLLIFELSKETSELIKKGTHHVRLSTDELIIYNPQDSILNVI